MVVYSWIMGLVLFGLSIRISLSHTLAALMLLLAASVVIPLCREWLSKKSGIEISDNIMKAIVIPILVLAAFFFIKTEIHLDNERIAQKAKEDAEHAQAQLAKDIHVFRTDREQTLKKIRSMIDTKQYADALIEIKKYIPENDEDINELQKIAATKEAAREDAKREEYFRELRQKERDEKIKNQFAGGQNMPIRLYIEEHMNDPDSYQHVKTTFIDKGDYLLVTTTFRGKNAFGGIIVNSLTAKVSIDGNTVTAIE